MTTSPTMTITDELLAELERKAKAATPGPWIDTESDECPEHERWVEAGGWSVCSTHSGIFGAESQYPNAEYIAAANPATILALVEHIRILTERLERAEADCEDLRRKCTHQHADFVREQARRESMERDAGRYRYFRDAGLPNGLGLYDDELDAEIDLQIAEISAIAQEGAEHE